MPVGSQPGALVRLITVRPRDPWPHNTSIITQPALSAAGASPLLFTTDRKTPTTKTTAEEERSADSFLTENYKLCKKTRTF